MSESAVTPDSGFSGDGRLEYPGLVTYSRSHLAVQDDQKILVVGGGSFGGYDFTGSAVVSRILPNGEFDPSFGHNADGTSYIYPGQLYVYGTAIAVQSDGKIIVAGSRDPEGPGYDTRLERPWVARLTENGELDLTFGEDGIFTTDDTNAWIYDVALQDDGKIILGGILESEHPFTNDDSDIIVMRLTKDGSPDATFADNGTYTYHDGLSWATSMRVQRYAGRERILIAGTVFPDTDSPAKTVIWCLDAETGSPDASFGPNGSGMYVYAENNAPPYLGIIDIAPQNEGTIVACGAISGDEDLTRTAIWRIAPGGEFEPGSGPGQTPEICASHNSGQDNIYQVIQMAVKSNGKIVLMGVRYESTSGTMRIALWQANSNGSIDESFNAGEPYIYQSPEPVPGYHPEGSYVAVQGDGKILVSANLGLGSELPSVIRFDYSSDCNQNGIQDEADIAGGSSQDCNSNGVPDECDIESGGSQDGNINGIPDECDGSLSKPFRIIAELNNWKGGDLSRFRVSVAPITGHPFDAYMCVVTPGGQILSIQSENRIVSGLRALAQNIHALPGGYSGTLLELSIPAGLKGDYRIIGGLSNAGAKVGNINDLFRYDIIDLNLN
ncbi:MAG: hypothetical protein NTZ78_07350 [Candidatus Aureabacteria bacterium]|nr:hypothetical protein [Candidatus Auribacterota bacterium]